MWMAVPDSSSQEPAGPFRQAQRHRGSQSDRTTSAVLCGAERGPRMGESPARVELACTPDERRGKVWGLPQHAQPPASCRNHTGGSHCTWALSPAESSPARGVPGAPQPTGRRALTRHVGGRKLLTLETPTHPPGTAGPGWDCAQGPNEGRAVFTDTWTLGPDGQAGPFLLSGLARPDCLPRRPAGASIPQAGGSAGAKVRPGPPCGGIVLVAGGRLEQLQGLPRELGQVRGTDITAALSLRAHAGSLSRSRAERGSPGGTRDGGGQGPGARTDRRPVPTFHSSHRTIRN